MKIIRHCFLLIALIIAAQSHLHANVPAPLSLYEVLSPLKDYQFTVEQTFDDQLTDKSFSSRAKSIDDLKMLFPDYDTTVDSKNPHLLHIVRKLIRTDSYALTKELAQFTYSGPAYYMLTKLPNISLDYSPTDSPSTLDSTNITVDVKNKTCLDIITECMPIDHFGPILWTATLHPDSKVAVDFWLKSVKCASLEDSLRAIHSKK